MINSSEECIQIDALQGSKKREDKSTPQLLFDGFRPMPCLLHCLRSRMHTVRSFFRALSLFDTNFLIGLRN